MIRFTLSVSLPVSHIDMFFLPLYTIRNYFYLNKYQGVTYKKYENWYPSLLESSDLTYSIQKKAVSSIRRSIPQISALPDILRVESTQSMQ